MTAPQPQPQLLLGGTFALYTDDDGGGYVLVTDVDGRGVERKHIPGAVVRLLTGGGPLTAHFTSMFGKGDGDAVGTDNSDG